MTMPVALELAAVFVFALTGALRASRAQLDIGGFLFLANITAVGGGTVRDLMLDRTVFWIAAPSYVAASSAGAVIVYFTAHLFESRLRGLMWLDAAALAIATSAGIAVAEAAGAAPVVQFIMGIITALMGGLMRDVVVGEVPLVLRAGELYATAAVVGALAAVITIQLSDSALLPVVVGSGMVFVLRAGSMAFGWNLPAYKPRPPDT